ncbi:21669_t:CDS:2, partial [Racocetra persica]
STVDDYVNSKSHQENKTKAKRSSVHTYQRTLQTTLSASDNRWAIIKDLVEVMESIPQASTLQQVYLPDIFENHMVMLKNLFSEKSVSIIMDETMDS